MGWDQMFAGLFAGWLLNGKDKKRNKDASQRVNFSSGVSSVSERLFVRKRDQSLPVFYKGVCLDEEDMDSNFQIFTLSDSERKELQYFYSRLEVVPASFDCRTQLVHFIFKLWRNGHENMIDLLQNELIYLVDYMQPYSQEEHMYQHLAMFLSAECYFFKGEFANALKRLYQALDWQVIYDDIDDRDAPLLLSFHEAIVSNIINLYALAGLSEKANEVRGACRALVKEAQETKRRILATSGDFASLKSFLQEETDMLMATDTFQGYYFIDDTAYTNNLFQESVTGIVKGQAIYGIEALPCGRNSVTTIEDYGEIDGKFFNYTSLCMQGFGVVHNYEAALSRDREKMRHI